MSTETSADFPVTVSVLTPAYNAEAVLERAVASVRAQTLADWEMIIVDDGSSDATATVAEALARTEPRLQVIGHARGQGAAAARNTALKAAQGRYIAFLDADDAWRPDKLEAQLHALREGQAALCYTGFMRITDDRAKRVEVPTRVTGAQLRLGNCVCCSSALYDRAVFGSVLMPDLALRQDYALWLTLLARVPFAVGINRPLVNLHVTRGSLSSNKWRAMQATWAMHHRHFGAGALTSAFYVLSHTLRRLLRG